MSIEKMPDGRWRVRVEMGRAWDGKRDRRSRTCRTKREAERAERELIAAGRGNGSPTLRGFVDSYWRPLKAGLAQTSKDSYEQDLRLRILPALGDARLERIDRLAVQRMIDSCGTAKTARRARDLLRSILNEAVACGAASSNPAAGRFSFPGRRPAGEPSGVWLTTFREHAALLSAAEGAGEVEKILLLGLCFGLRKGEILALDVGDLDFGRRTLRVRRGYVRTSRGNVLKETKTAKSARVLPMSAHAAERLAELTAGAPPGPVCRSRAGGRLSPSTASKMLRRWLAENGQPAVTMQTLRHSFASACIDAGIDVAKVSAWLGHTNVTTTYNRYVKTRRKDLGAAVAAMDDAMAFYGNGNE